MKIEREIALSIKKTKNWIPWTKSASKLYRPRDRRLSAMVVPIFAETGCNVVSVTDPYGRILGFLDRSRYIFFQGLDFESQNTKVNKVVYKLYQ
jgi:hypothetical protein